MGFGRLGSVGLLLAVLLRLVHANIDFLKPDANTEFNAQSGRATVDVAWQDRGYPPEEALTSADLRICTGVNDKFQCEELATLELAQFRTGRYTAQIPATQGTDGYYFFQMNVKWGSDNQAQYSNRFFLRGMTGTVQAALVYEANSPEQENHINRNDYKTMSRFQAPYVSQTGRARFAPMQTQPGTRVTATAWTRQFPSSDVSYFKSAMPTMLQLTTVTPSWDYSISSAANDALPAFQPIGNGGWYHPSKRLSMTARKTNL